MQSRKEKGRAPYTKYGKAPFQYSDSYQNWRVAAIAGREQDRAHWAHQHNKRFGPLSWKTAA